MTESVTALATCDHLSIERAYQQLQRLRKLVVQAECSHNAQRIVNRTRDKRHSS